MGLRHRDWFSPAGSAGGIDVHSRRFRSDRPAARTLAERNRRGRAWFAHLATRRSFRSVVPINLSLGIGNRFSGSANIVENAANRILAANH